MKFRILLLLSLFLCSTSWANGFDGEYKAYLGDFNNDGLDDIYVKKAPQIILLHGDIVTPILIPSDVNNFILQQNSALSFDIISGQAQINQAESMQWTEVVSAFALIAEDINLDGYIDILLKGLDFLVAGMADHAVYAPTQANEAPSALSVIDGTVIKFFDEVFNYAIDENYFIDNAAPVYGPVQHSELFFVPEYCGTASEGEMAALPPVPPRSIGSEPNVATETARLLSNCTATWGAYFNVHYDLVLYYWNETEQIGLDFSMFDPRSMSISDVLKDVYKGTEDIIGGGVIENVIKDVLEEVLGVEGVFGGIFDQGGQVYEDDEGIETDRFRAFIQLAQVVQAQQTQPASPFVNPLPGATINKANSSQPYSCTADGRYGNFRPGGHNGVDLGSGPTKTVQVGTDVYAAGSGVAVPGFGRGHGTLVELYHSGGRYLFRYSHLSAANPRGRVNGGAIIGKVGKSGNASAACIKPHLHFEAGDRTTNTLVDPQTVSAVFTWPLEQ